MEKMEKSENLTPPTICVLGKGNVGKTSLIIRYINNTCPGTHDPTVEDTHSVTIKVGDSDKTFNILDTAGEEDYQSMADRWIESSSGFLLVLGIDEEDSLAEAKTKYERIKKNGKDKCPIILVGNKCDLESSRQVKVDAAQSFANQINSKYYETSAKTDSNGNVKVVFQECARMIYSQQPKIDEIIVKKKCCCNIY